METEQEKNKEQEWEEQDSGGLVWPRVLRRAAALGGAVLIVAGGALIWNGVRRESSTQEDVLASYTVQTASHARVHLLQNSLYPEPWLEVGAICAGSLTDYIELTFSAEASVEAQNLAEEQSDQQPAAAKQDSESRQGANEKNIPEVTGTGTVTAALSGYQVSGDSKKTVYEQKTVLQEQSGEENVEIKLQIRPADYLARAEAADQILGGSVSKSLTMLFQGTFQIHAAEKTEEQPFSCQVEIPLVSQGGFYEITLPETDLKNGTITETKTTVLPVRWTNVAGGIAGILSGLFLIWFVLWITREPDEKEAWERGMRTLLKKYGSQFLGAEEMPETAGKHVIRLHDMESLIQISEDQNAPILYVPDQKGLPQDGCFLVFGSELCYEVQFDPEPAEQ